MPDVSLINVPDVLMEKLRQRARQNHRSVQGELISIIESAVAEKEFSLEQAELHLRQLNYKSKDDSAGLIRELRDAHQGTSVMASGKSPFPTNLSLNT